ncbi:putative ribonuclease H-like domain-containing protein, partial [Tanacetum coccineum]
DKGDILLVKVYVDDIIFGSTKKLLCIEFKKMMHKKFQISSMGELTFFLGLQVKQKEDGIFISQDKYVTKILKKFSFTNVKTASTPMETQKALLKDEDGEEVDVHLYRSMIGSLMYLTSSRPDIMFTVCACTRYQVNLKVSHLHAMKRIFRYLKGQPKLGLWYPKDSHLDLVAYTDSDYAGASLDRKSTTRVNAGDSKLMLLGINLLLLMKVNVAKHKLTAARKRIILLVLGKVNAARHKLTTAGESWICLPNATIFEELTRMGYEKLSQKLTFYKAFFSPQWKFLIHTILQCLSAKTTAWNEFSSTMASAIICLATNQKFNFSKYIFEIMVKNLDNVVKFLMYLRIVQVFLDKQLEGMSSHKRIYVTPSLLEGLFRKYERQYPLIPSHTHSTINISTSRKQKPRKQRERHEVPLPSGPTMQCCRLGFNEEMDDVWKGLPLLLMALMREQDRETYGGIQLLNLRRSENVSKLSNDPLLARGNTLRSGEDRLKLQELMELCTNLQNRVIDLENTKTAQAQEITSLKLRVKKLEKKGGSRTHKLKRLYKVGRSARIVSSDEASLGDQEDASKQGRKIDDIDKDAEITLVDETQGRYGDDIMFDVSDLAGEEVFVAEQGVPDSKKDDAAQVNTVATTVSTASTIC